LAARLARALNNGAKAEAAIARFVKYGMIKTAGELPVGRGGPPRASKPAVDLRAFVKSLDVKPGGGDDGAAIRRDKESPHG
jgi:hypothetical protein